MPKLHARHHGTRYDQEPETRMVGSCLEPSCPGHLRVGRDGDHTVISCGICPQVWDKSRWVELAQLIQERDEEISE